MAFSNYQNTAFTDPNFAAQGIGNYQRDHQFRIVAGYDAELFGDNNTRIEFFYNLRSGQRYSYTFNDPTNGRSAVFGVNGRGSRGLLYVPDVSSLTADSLVTYDSQATFAAFQSFVQNSELNGYQGQIAEKNIGKTPWVHKLDFSVRQEVPFVFGGKLELMADGPFKLTETYKGEAGAPNVVEGTWTVEDGGKRVLLDPNSKSEQDRSYEIVSNDEIRMLGQDGKPVESQLNYSLKREPK